MAGFEVAGWFASPLIDKVLGLAGSFLEQTCGSNQEADRLLFDLKISLLTVKGQIEVLETNPVPSQTLPEWLRELKDSAYEAFDILDTIEYRNISQKFNHQSNVSMIASSSVSAVKRVIFSDCDLQNLKLVVHKIKTVCGGVENLIHSLNLKDNEIQRIQKRPKKGDTTHHLDSLRVFGRDEEINLILDMMGIRMNNPESSQKVRTREKPEPSNRGEKSTKGESSRTVETNSDNYPLLGVIPIVGITGVGKTALAKIIYNNQSVIEHFELRSWVYVPESKGIETVFRRVIESIEPERPALEFNGEFNLYRYTFDGIIKGKRILLVLDNLGEADLDWGYLYGVLIKGVAPGSIVLVTTQNHKVADEVGTMTRIRLDVLQQNYFWPLFEHYALGREFSTLSYNNKSLQLIGKEIAERLNGLPLAAVATGYLLRQKLDRENWKNILESDWWNIGSNSGHVLPSLVVSFQHLDMELRQCFAFCSLFPKGIFTRDDLIEMWIAHDFIKPKHSNSLRGLANKRFDQLLERCFFQPVSATDTFYIPDSVRDLAFALSSNETCIIKDENRCVPHMVRHLTLSIDEFGNVEWGNCKMERLRSLLVYCHLKKEDYHILNDTLSKSTNLRVLDLSCVNLENEPPYAISSLLHIRSLNLAHTGIVVFPKSFCRLFHLQVLNLKGCGRIVLPKEFNQLTNLHFLRAHHRIVSQIYGIGKLTNLQSLSIFSVRNKKGFRLKELKEMNEIDGCLRIENLNEVSSKEETIEAKLTEKKFLRRLEFVWEFSQRPSTNDDVKILEGLQPHVNIEELVIDGYRGTTFLGWMVENHSFTNLQFICLRNGNLAVLPNVGRLPSLVVLKIESLNSIARIDSQIYGNGTDIFPSLKELSFSSMSRWEEWSDAPAGRFIPCLKKLSIMECEQLRRIPFQSLGSGVTELEISKCGPFANEMCRHFQRLTALTTLKISRCKRRISIPCYNLRLLEYLCLQSCDSLHFAGGLKFLVKLKKLEISHCGKVVDESLHLERSNSELGLTSLIYLKVDYTWHLRINMLGNLPLLRVLKVFGCNLVDSRLWFSELISLEEFEISSSFLPSGIESLPSLKKLTLRGCHHMELLPHNGLPHSLKELYIIRCSKKLTDRCRHSGEDWPKIAHVPYIRVDGVTIQRPSA